MSVGGTEAVALVIVASAALIHAVAKAIPVFKGNGKGSSEGESEVHINYLRRDIQQIDRKIDGLTTEVYRKVDGLTTEVSQIKVAVATLQKR